MSVLYIRDKDGKLVPVPSIMGAEGKTGAEGFSPVVEISKSGKVTTVTITDAAGIHTATINDGQDGAEGSSEIVESVTELVSVVSSGSNLNEGVYEYGTFTGSTGEENDSMTPVTVSFRSATYLPVEGGRAIAIYYEACEWNNNNKGKSFKVVEYDANRNILVSNSSVPSYSQTDMPTHTLNTSTAFIRIAFDKWSEVTTPLEEIEIAIYYAEDAVKEFIPHEVQQKVYMIPRDKVNGLETLRGKKIVYDGDSICESRTSGAAANGGGYAKLIADYTGSTYDNQAVGGARLCANDSVHSVVNNLDNLPADGDLYCFEGGINDFWGNTPIGDCSLTDYTSEVDTSTICGALETIFRYCLTNFLGKPVCFVITHKIGNTAYSANSNGNTFRDYRDAMVKVCEKYSVPYYDAFTESGLNGWNDIQNSAYLTASGDGTASDGIHPNAEGYKRYYMPQLLKLFRGMMSVI